MATMEELEKRIKALEDVEAIKMLKARYCAFCDDGYDADGIAGLFVEDGLWDGGMRGQAEGREEMRSFFRRAPQRLPFAIHMVMNPIIQVEGDIARGTWYLFQPCTFAEGDRVVWGSARYDEEYVRVDGEWMFSSLKLTSFFWTPFDKGWARERFA